MVYKEKNIKYIHCFRELGINTETINLWHGIIHILGFFQKKKDWHIKPKLLFFFSGRHSGITQVHPPSWKYIFRILANASLMQLGNGRNVINRKLQFIIFILKHKIFPSHNSVKACSIQRFSISLILSCIFPNLQFYPPVKINRGQKPKCKCTKVV